jgi:hypothetical protein
MIYRVEYQVNRNRVYCCNTRQLFYSYIEYINIDSTDNVNDLLYRYGWVKYGLTEVHYTGCRACDPHEDVNQIFCGYSMEKWEPVPTPLSLSTSYLDELSDKLNKEWLHKKQLAKDKDEIELKLFQKEESDIADILKRRKIRLTGN